MKNISIKHLLPRFQIESYRVYNAEELDLIIIQIKNFLNGILENQLLLNQIEEIIGMDFIQLEKW